MKRIFLSKDFYSPPSYATQIKSPVHLLVSTYRKMGLREVPTIPDAGRMTAGLGQSLFDPPNVAGWAGGRTWITPSTLLQRGNMFRDVLFPDTKGFARPIARCRRPMRASASAWLGNEHHRSQRVKATLSRTRWSNRDEDSNTRYGGYAGYLLAFKRPS